MSGERDYHQLVADEETLRLVTEELVEARLVIRQAQAALSPRVQRSLAEGAPWVRLGRRGVLALLNYRMGDRG